MVTSVPMSAIVEANSHPMAPPPITAAVFGSSGIERNSSEVSTISPSTSKPGMVRGREPAAMTTESPEMVTDSDSPPSIETLWPACSRPWPSNMVTLRPLSSWPRPPTRVSTTFCLRSSVVDQSIPTSPTVNPNSAAPITVR